MRTGEKIILVVLLVVGIGIGIYCVQRYEQTRQDLYGQAVPSCLYPDRQLTPGVVATQDFKVLTAVSGCGTYSQCHRQTTGSMKDQVCKEYSCPDSHHEIDHLIPLALGGADDVKNLWAQPEVCLVNGQDFGFHTKDKIETYLVNQMKAAKISPKDAQDCLLKDWVVCYQKYLGNKFGASVGATDPDNQ